MELSEYSIEDLRNELFVKRKVPARQIELILDKPYILPIDLNMIGAGFGNSREQIQKMDGRPWASWLENLVNNTFIGVTPSPSSGSSDYDHLLPSGRKADSKLLTRLGVSIGPSMNKGDRNKGKDILKNQGAAARAAYDQERQEALDKKLEQIIIIVEITPIQEGIGDYVRLIAVEGADLKSLAKGKEGRIPLVKAKQAIFKD